MRLALLLSVTLAIGCGGDDGSPFDQTDGAVSTAITACDTPCGTGELCVVNWDGVCNQGVARCVATTCEANGQCTTECDAELCSSPFTCTSAGCQGELADDFGCRGP